MKVQTRKKSSATAVISKVFLVDPRERDIVFEAVEEALLPQVAVSRTRRTYQK